MLQHINLNNSSFKIGVIALLCFLSFNIATATQSLDRIVAIAGEEVITNLELERNLKVVSTNLEKQNIPLPPRNVLAKQVLEKMILDLLQLQLAKKLAIDIDQATVNQSIAELAKQHNLTLAEYKQKIAEQGVSFAEFKRQLREEIIISRLHQREIINHIRVSPAEITGYINSPVGQDNSGTEYRLSHILVASPENPNLENPQNLNSKVATIMQEIHKGKNFKEIAASYSAGAEALNGGDLGWRKIGQVPTIFVKDVINMKINEVIGPIKSDSGLHIIKLVDKRNKNQFAQQELRARQIFMLSHKEGRSEQQVITILIALRDKILAGKKEDFAKLAATKSEDSLSAVKGGDLGWFNHDAVLPEFWEKVNKLEINEISKPFKSELGWHLVKLEGRRSASHKDSAHAHALEIIREQKFHEALENWLKTIRAQAKVQIFLN